MIQQQSLSNTSRQTITCGLDIAITLTSVRRHIKCNREYFVHYYQLSTSMLFQTQKEINNNAFRLDTVSATTTRREIHPSQVHTLSHLLIRDTNMLSWASAFHPDQN